MQSVVSHFGFFAVCLVTVYDATLDGFVESRGVGAFVGLARLTQRTFAERLETAANGRIALGTAGDATDVFLG